MQFILIVETNHKENETFLHYCQWTGNEEELEKLVVMLEKADYDDLYGGDFSSFWFSRTKVSESAVDEHVKLEEFGSYSRMFQKHTGKFVCPEFDGDTECPYNIANQIDRYFFACRLEDFFHK